MKRLLPVIFLAVVILAGLFVLNLMIFVKTPSGEAEQSLRIERGTPLGTILRELEERGVISSGPLFRAYLIWKKAPNKIRAGEYSFPPRIRPAEVLSLLIKGDFTTRRITIPEGWTAREIAGYLGGLGLVDTELFLKKCADLEGYLFPDTYQMYRPKDEDEVIHRFVEHFREIYSREFEAKAREAGLSEKEVITLASIVEKETATPSERPIIASVFFNRLKKGMPLATDPTVIYGMAAANIPFSGNLRREDLSRPGPYNTYLNPGLPPTPISNPGADAIRAVLYPAATDFLYFVSKNDGTHQFSRTEEEHLAAVRKYQLNRFRQRAETRPAMPTPRLESTERMPETLPASP